MCEYDDSVCRTGDLGPDEDPYRIPWTHPRPKDASDGNSVGDTGSFDIGALTLPSTCPIERLRRELSDDDAKEGGEGGEITLASGTEKFLAACSGGISAGRYKAQNRFDPWL